MSTTEYLHELLASFADQEQASEEESIWQTKQQESFASDLQTYQLILEELVSMLNCSDNARVCLHSLKSFDVRAFKASNGRLAL